MLYGARGIGDWIDANIRHVQHLHRLVESRPDFEAANRPTMSAICIRYRGENMDEAESKQLHAEVASRVERSGYCAENVNLPFKPRRRIAR
jgi:glutamate/tyrosine decarboxylase-like PLP-dependent enzyme